MQDESISDISHPNELGKEDSHISYIKGRNHISSFDFVASDVMIELRFMIRIKKYLDILSHWPYLSDM